jgi:E3 ubiquitin-protein ligase SHPRH
MSPLVGIFWFRCILDEAQMVESTTTRVSAMAKLIPRWYSWAVTGTPMKSDYNDLFGLYNFLELETTVSLNASIFQKVHSDLQHKGLFFDFTKTTMRRNMKSLLTSQIFIPRQSRHVVHIPFSTIEQHYYEDLWRQCKLNLRLDWMDSIGWQVPADASEAMKETYRNIKMRMRSWVNIVKHMSAS